MSDDDTGFLLAMLFIVWGIPLIFWAISVSFEWATWQLVLLGILQYISPGIAFALYLWITDD